MTEHRLGISGRITRGFFRSEITPLLALVAFLLGVFAVIVTPREEEPQINVTFANVFIPFPGASPTEVEHLIATPAEQVLSEISGIKHVYSVSRPGLAVLTVQFRVGEDRTDAIVRLYDKVFSNLDWLPANLGAGRPIIKPRSIDDVPIVTATLWTTDKTRSAHDLLQIAHALEAELQRVPGTRQISTIGGPDRAVLVTLDPIKLAGFGIALNDLSRALKAANASTDGGSIVADNLEIPVKAGTFLSTADEVAGLIVGLHGGKPVYMSDVATIGHGPDFSKSYVQFAAGPAGATKGLEATGRLPAVTLAIAKKPGTNAVVVAKRLRSRLEELKGLIIPEGVSVTLTRDYGQTADAKATKLIQKLGFATGSVILLVILTMGWRPAIVVGIAVVITLAVTLFASWAYGFTINRVSLFALIFSIGILVDDAIVVVENIHRHVVIGGRKISELIPRAVDEVGGPTILATFTVIAALLPMAFVTGLMGPYMSPIPINASMGMLLSLAVAFIMTPWLACRLIARKHDHGERPHDEAGSRMGALAERVIGPFLRGPSARRKRYMLAVTLIVLVGLSASLGVARLVILKMLPFDNKSEFQIVLDMPAGTALEETARVLSDIADVLDTVPEVSDYQIYAGTASPIGFNGLVRQYYLREEAYQGDIQVNLTGKHNRNRLSHEIARDVRTLLAARITDTSARIKVVEVPPGPPVLSPLVAEIYGLDYAGQIAIARLVRKAFAETADIVDIDDSTTAPNPRLIVAVDRARAARLGIAQSTISTAFATLLGGEDATYLHRPNLKHAVPVRLLLPVTEKGDLDTILALRLTAADGTEVPLSEVVTIRNDVRQQEIYHKDLLPVVYVFGDMAGDIDSPLYGMFEMYAAMNANPTMTAGGMQQFLFSQPDNPVRYALKWDGEWQITFETFRDMGIAYAAGILMIYFLVVAQFRSYLVPLIIMAPIPLTLIGVMPGHALMSAKFTATSMIGMIALAGIIVRNSILLVDFINQQRAAGMELTQAVVQSAAVRTKPIVLTALAAMMGAFFIVDDPIFNGLAVSLIFGILVSTVLTLVVIPVVYFSYLRRKDRREARTAAPA